MSSFSVLSWNTFGIKSYGIFLSFKKAARLIESYTADIICLQEMNFAKKKLLEFKRLKGYTSVIPYANRRELELGVFNNNVILSKFRVIRRGEITFPKIFRFLPVERVLYVDLDIHGTPLRIYNCHLAILRAGIRERFSQLERILNHARDCLHPVIICGDMNTFIRESGLARKILAYFHKVHHSSLFLDGKYFLEDERHEFERRAKEAGFTENLSLKATTWSLFGTGFELFNLKLDWFLTRGISNVSASLGPYLSDHRPVLARCEA